MWQCQECGRKFKTVAAAERASRNGCPKCGGVDVDLDVTLVSSDGSLVGSFKRRVQPDMVLCDSDGSPI